LATAKAPLRETLAAAALLGAGWDPSAPLLDPMCGAGTIPIEAALLARRIPPGLSRKFAFQRWPGFDAARWERIVAEGRGRALARAPAPIAGSDRDAGAIEAALANAARAGVGDDVVFRRAALSAIEPPDGPGWVVTNPPYGVRVGARGELRNLFGQLGNVLRRCCPGWQVALLSADRQLERQVGLSFAAKFETNNGGIRIRLVTAAVPSGPPRHDSGRATGSLPARSLLGSSSGLSSP
jgi:putative N6-adenine-specific DNA methylase